jgi:hypothetical protein
MITPNHPHSDEELRKIMVGNFGGEPEAQIREQIDDIYSEAAEDAERGILTHGEQVMVDALYSILDASR